MSSSGDPGRGAPVSPEERDEALIRLAQGVAANAYCPYSGFSVGAAVLWEDGSTTVGCNVENAAFSPSVCAERNAIVHGVSLGLRKVSNVVVYTPTTTPTTPCGVCLQTMSEFGPSAVILCVCNGPQRIRGSLAEFLPHGFGPHSLGKMS